MPSEHELQAVKASQSYLSLVGAGFNVLVKSVVTIPTPIGRPGCKRVTCHVDDKDGAAFKASWLIRS